MSVSIVPELRDTLPTIPDGWEVDNATDLRATPRIDLCGNVTLLEPRYLTGTTIDVSAGGMRAVFDEPLSMGQDCLAVIRLPSGETAQAHARVVWGFEHGDRWEAGLRFT
jgi:hypothetical protein